MLLQDLKITERFNWKRPVFRRKDLGEYLRKNWERICLEQVITVDMIKNNRKECEGYFISDTPKEGFYCLVDKDIKLNENLHYTCYILGNHKVEGPRYTAVGQGMFTVGDNEITNYGTNIDSSINITFRNESKGIVRGEAYFLARDNSFVKAYDKAVGSALDTATVCCYNNVDITSYKKSQIFAKDKCLIKAMDESEILAFDDCLITGTMNAKIAIQGNVKVDLFDNARLVNFDKVFPE